MRSLSILIILVCSAVVTQFAEAQGVSINTNGANPDTSAILDVSSNVKGILIPRMTTAERNAISLPAQGLIIYNNNCQALQYYNGYTWVTIGNIGGISTPGVVTGTSTPCQNGTGIAYSISPVSGATGYNWSVPAGASVASGQGTNSITVDFGTSGGTICVVANDLCGSSSASCLTVNTITAPGAPTATAASSVQQNSFNANWNSVAGATTYYLDVSKNSGFSTFVAGYNNLNVGGVTTYNVSGLDCDSTYYYRVRAANACGTGTSSNTITVTMQQCCLCPLAGFPYRKPISITNTTGLDLTDYQVKLIISYDADMKSDFSDIRFGDSTCTLLDYWNVGYTASSTDTFWVKVPSIPQGGTTIFMYYGNPAASSLSDPVATMEFYDAFPSDISGWSTNIWISSGTGNITWESGKLKNYIEHCSYVEAFKQVGDYASPTGLMFEFDWNAQTSGWYEDPGWKVFLGTVNTTTDPVSAPSTPIDDWNGSCAGCFINGPNQNNFGHRTGNTTASGVTTILFRLYGSDGWCSAGDHYWTLFKIDNVFARKYYTPEPAASSGAEGSCP